ncbi:methionine synthase reductase isoform X2 [Hydra vulgaris]|uniref:Methionine synthase reductase n=1 Tax=Hydra vulgaris TaxID=6087 RepID=A0ABM4CWR9_HYDVU
MSACKKKEFIILYGSQTGQAEAISEEIYEQALKRGFHPARFCLSQIEKKFSLEKESCAVIVCSTTGEGEPPDKALKFVRRIKKKTLPPDYFKHLSYALLGLGDSNYTNFCLCGKNIDNRLQELGAIRFYETGYGDDAVGLEVGVEPWIEGLFIALSKHFDVTPSLYNNTIQHFEEKVERIIITHISEHISIQSEKTNFIEGKLDWLEKSNMAGLKSLSAILNGSVLKIPSSPEPFLQLDFLSDQSIELENTTSITYPNSATDVKAVRVAKIKQLTHDPSVKKTFEIELDIQDTEFVYEPGNSIGVICYNEKKDVEYIINRLKLSEYADKKFTLNVSSDTVKRGAKVPDYIPKITTLRNIFMQYVDFRAVPRKAFLRMLADYTYNDPEKKRLQELCSSQGSKDFDMFVRANLIGLVELLQTFHSCNPPVERLIEMLPRLFPREYSVASSPSVDPTKLKFVFNLIEHPPFQETARYGLCTRWLSKMAFKFSNSVLENLENLHIHENLVNIYFRKPTNFRLPVDSTKPLIMIGPGTGIAPFIGFLQKRHSLMIESYVLGEAYLFYGCRYKDKDFLYKEDITRYKSIGVITDCIVSFSREENEPKYVQDNIRCHKEKVMSLLFERDGFVFICGDAKGMGRDVTNTFVDLIEEYKKVSKPDALKLLSTLRENKRFVEETWT